jgi:hypothetical protein
MPDYVTTVAQLLPLGTYSSSMTGLGNTYTFTIVPRAAALELVVTQASTSNVTVDVYVQHALTDGSSSGPIWDDFVHFTQVTAAGNQIAQWCRDVQPSSSGSTLAQQLGVHTQAAASLTAGTMRQGPTGPNWRAQYVIAGGSSSQQAIKFALVAHLLP